MSLDVRHLTHRYRSGFALHDVSLTFPRAITGVIGPNGAGKSTLVKCIASVLQGSGEVYYDGERVAPDDRRFYAEKVSYLPQFSRNDATITVFEAVLLGLLNTLALRVRQTQIESAHAMLDGFGLHALARRRLCDLSGGQVQLVLLAQALVKQPAILLLDEPLNNLDIHRQFAFMDRIRELSGRERMVTVMVMHDIAMTARYADNVVVMSDGDVYAHGAPRDVISPRMLRDIYQVDATVGVNVAGHPAIDFLGIAACQR